MKKILFLFSFFCCKKENENPTKSTLIDHENNKYDTNPKNNSKTNLEKIEKNDLNSPKIDDKKKDNQNENNFKNILLVGLTGSGKSYFVNYICEKNLAETGESKGPITKTINIYPIEDLKINLIDTPSIESKDYTKDSPIGLTRLSHEELFIQIKEFCKDLKINSIILLCNNDLDKFYKSLYLLSKISSCFTNTDISKKIFIRDIGKNEYFKEYIKFIKEYLDENKIKEEDIVFLDMKNKEKNYRDNIINQLIK